MSNKAALTLAKILGDLNRNWTAHPAQHLILHAIFGQKKMVTMLECGRKFGKTEIDAYFLWRLALTNPGEYYFFTPLQNQAREVVWANRRLQNFGPAEYLADVNESEMRIKFKNGSFIKVDGSDNFDKYRGPNPKGAVYDEFRDFRPEFHPAFGPNLATYKAPLLINGTPPELDLPHYDGMLAECRAEEGQAYFNFPSWANPHVDRKWLQTEKRKLYARGEGDVWEREFAARRVRGGSNSLFPMFDRSKHVRPHADVMAALQRDKKKLIWQVGCDPGNATVFCVIFRAINPYTKVVYALDEIYETSQAETSTSRIVPRIQAMREELCPGWEAHGIEWEQVYDEAATWFATEALNTYGEVFTPTSKASNAMDEGLSLIKDQMLHGLTVISDRCNSLVKEFENFVRDPKTGKPRRDCADHAIDAFRYLNSFAGIDLSPEGEPTPKDPDDSRRFVTPEQDLEDAAADDDEAWGVLEDF